MRALEIQEKSISTKISAGSGPDKHSGNEQDAASIASDRAALAGESRQPCKLRMRVAQVKADLIRKHEIELLVPAAGQGASEVLRLLCPATEKGFQMGMQAATNNPLPSSMVDAAMIAVSDFNAAPISSGGAGCTTSANVSGLVGLSCIFGANGEVCLIQHTNTPSAAFCC